MHFGLPCVGAAPKGSGSFFAVRVFSNVFFRKKECKMDKNILY